MGDEETEKRSKATHVGAPAIFSLELACRQLNEAFDGHCYLVGSAIQRPDWRDVDVRLIVEDGEFSKLFPKAGRYWEFDTKWLLTITSISAWLQKVTGLPVDFQIQPRKHANDVHPGPRHALGMSIIQEPQR